ncbi:hypothetical protein [Paraburkholderia hayleyella]|uniref:hypothetical protein n=1 Tax=Paraburkholderia hayleyella TaxID=2152889 RepID=UPI001C65F6A0|nr:hypothetical protein [Paraburkholderia hayleyella]
MTSIAYAAIERSMRREQAIEQTGAPVWELRDQFETALARGMPLEALPNGDALIQANLVRHPMLTSVDVFTPLGRTVFSTDASTIGSLVPANWQAVFQHWRVHITPRWLARKDGYTTYGVPLLDHRAMLAGYISITYRTPAAPPFDMPLVSLKGALTSLTCTLLACFLFAVTYRPVNRFVLSQTTRIARAQERSAAALIPHAAASAEPAEAAGTASAEVRSTPLDEALARLRASEARIAAAERFLSNRGSRDEQA